MTGAHPSDGPRSPWKILAVLFSGVLLGALDIAIVAPALPALREHFGVGSRDLGWIISVYMLFNLIGVPTMAKLSDRWGRRAIYGLDVVLFALGSIVVASSPSWTLLLMGRAIQGLGAGGLLPVAAAVIGDTFPAEERGRALGAIGAVFGLAFLVGPVIGGVILGAGSTLLGIASWRWLFLVNIPLAALVFVGAVRMIPGTRSARATPFDTAGIALLAVVLASLAIGVNQWDVAAGWDGLLVPSAGVPAIIALLGVPLLIVTERRAADPVIDLDLVARRPIAAVMWLAAVAGLAEAAVVFVPDLLVEIFGVTPSIAAYMLLPVVLAMAVGAPLAGRAVDAIGSRAVIRVGVALMAAGFMGVPLVADSTLRFYGCAVLVGLGMSALLGAPLRYVVLGEAPAGQRASAQGVLTLSMSVGQVLGGAAIGGIAASFGGGRSGFEAAFLAVGILAASSLLVSAGLRSRSDERSAAEAPTGG